MRPWPDEHKQLLDLLERRAIRALHDRDWILLRALSITIGELDLHTAVLAGAERVRFPRPPSAPAAPYFGADGTVTTASPVVSYPEPFATVPPGIPGVTGVSEVVSYIEGSRAPQKCGFPDCTRLIRFADDSWDHIDGFTSTHVARPAQ